MEENTVPAETAANQLAEHWPLVPFPNQITAPRHQVTEPSARVQQGHSFARPMQANHVHANLQVVFFFDFLYCFCSNLLRCFHKNLKTYKYNIMDLLTLGKIIIFIITG